MSSSSHSGQSTNAPSALTLEIHKKLNETKHSGQGWNQLWADGATPWNLGQSAPPLRELFESKLAMLQSNNRSELKCLVPGCGEGHDVIYLAQQDHVSKVVGLEISELALNKIRSHVSSELPENQQEKVDLILQDFFTLDPSKQKFNLVFDYTFYCAILPSLRPQWARKMGDLIEPRGLLVTLVFPIGDFENGPPFAVNFEGYRQLLEKDFQLIEGPYESPMTVKARKGRELVAIWERKDPNHRL